MQSNNIITVTTGSRLHFGLWGWGSLHEREFGGVGTMIDSPTTVVSIAPAERLTIIDPTGERFQSIAESWNHSANRPKISS